MHRTPLIAARRVSPFEGFAWYWLWSGTLCLWLVPAAREVSQRFGWLPYWLVGAPLALLVVQFLLSCARHWGAANLRSSPSPLATEALMTPADLAVVAGRLRAAPAIANAPATRARARRRKQRLAAIALLSR